MHTNLNNEKGMGLLELMIVIGILSVAILGMLQLFIFTSTGATLGNNKTLAIAEAQGKIDEIRNYEFEDISTDYANGGTMGDTFSLSLITGMGKIYIDDSNDQLLTVEVVVSWEDKFGRIIGEDTDLDGALDAGEDANGNGKLDSIVEMSTQIGDR